MDAINDFFTVLSSDTCRLLDLFLRLIINTAFTITIARCFYFPKARRRDFFFTYILLGFCIFMLIHLMGDAKIKTGIAMGLFAIFCIMRYRTESVPIREMTYLSSSPSQPSMVLPGLPTSVLSTLSSWGLCSQAGANFSLPTSSLLQAYG